MAEFLSGPAQGPIRIPEWENVLHVRPREPITTTDRRAWNEYLDSTNARQTPVAALREQLAARERAGAPIPDLSAAQIDLLDIHQALS